MKSLFLLFLLFSINLYSQPIVFNNTYSFTGMDMSQSFLKVDDGYIVGGNLTDSIGGFFVAKFDTFGTLVMVHKFYKEGLYNWFKCMKRVNNSGYFFVMTHTSSVYPYLQTGIIYRINENLDTLWSRNYMLINNSTLFYSINNTLDNNFVITGSANNKALLTKIDSLGNILWYKFYAGPGDMSMYACNSIDSGYIISGYTYQYNNNVEYDERGDWLAIKTDSTGNLQWQKHFGNPIYSEYGGAMIIATSDTCFIFSSGITVGADTVQSVAIKIDYQGQVKWKKYYGNAGDYFEDRPALVEIIELRDNKYIGIGWENQSKCYLLNKDGEIIFYRNFFIPGFSPSVEAGLNYVFSTSDDGFIFQGQESWYNPINIWLVKTDKNGCDGESSCQDTLLAAYAAPHDTTVFSGQNVKIRLFPINGHAPLSAYYSTGETHYPVYLSSYYATDSIEIIATQDTTILISVNDQWGNYVFDTVTIHVVNYINENLINPKINIFNYSDNTYVVVSGCLNPNVKIYSITGQLIIADKGNKINISNLDNGMYFCKINETTKKFCKIK